MTQTVPLSRDAIAGYLDRLDNHTTHEEWDHALDDIQSLAPVAFRMLLSEMDTHTTQAELKAAREEVERLSHDIDRHVAACADYAMENERMRAALEYAVSMYGKPGGPWNVPGDPGGWLERARQALASQPDTMGGGE